MKKQFLQTSILIIGILLIGAGCGQTSINNTTPQNTTIINNQQNIPTSNQTTTQTPVTTPKPTPTTTGPKTFTMTEVAQHNSASSCYTVINGKVYDLTSFAPGHPGGEQYVLMLCGIDGTNAFDQKHGGQGKPEAILEQLQIGILK